MPTILVVEDDQAIRRGVFDALHYAGYVVLEAAEGGIAMDLVRQVSLDLVLLDLVLPNYNGFEILAELQKHSTGTPVIILSARGEEADRVKGLKLGADDYVVKPFSVRELLARVEAVLRRSPERVPQVSQVTFPEGVVDLARMELQFTDGTCTELSERECELLSYMNTHASRVISREELLRRVWRMNAIHALETRTVDMHVANLRTKLRDNEAKFLLTVRGKGYKLMLG